MTNCLGLRFLTLSSQAVAINVFLNQVSLPKISIDTLTRSRRRPEL
jgi:hypothetical protein